MQKLSSAQPSSPVFRGSRLIPAALCLATVAGLTGCGSGGTPTVVTPSVSPAAGAYQDPITVTLSPNTPGASVYYTPSGSSGSRIPYNGPFQVGASETLQVMSSAKGYNDSPPVSVSYIIIVPADMPVITPASGTYPGSIKVSISDTAPGANIFYTTDGSTPTGSSPLYAGPFTVARSETVKAIAFAPNYKPSPVATASYKIAPPLPPLGFACLSGCTVNPVACPGASQGVLQALGWTDLTGNLWLFGGQTKVDGVDVASDLWTFSLTTDLWTQVAGPGTIDAPGVYGTLGVPDPASYPGARFASYTWTDATGNFWLFGGHGYDATGTSGLLNDLWTYNPATNVWTWIGGSQTANASGVYGTLGTPAAANIPGARSAGMSWKDATGNIWLFGATGVDSTGTNGALNDLWEFSPATTQWTWVSGSSVAAATPSYGLLGVPAATNTPGGYSNVSIGAQDGNGNLLLSSGTGASSTAATTMLNTLWSYSTTTGQWTWVSGSSVGLVSGSYGMLGIPTTTTVPGSRRFGLGWTDIDGNLWAFGGYGLDSAGTPGYLNDLWKYDTTAAQWTWAAGSNTVDAVPVYGNSGSSAANIGGAREYSVGWTGTDGSFYFFGGYGYNVAGREGYLADLWQFTP